jgi:nitroreductase
MANKPTIFNTIPKLDYTEQATECNINEFKKVVESRRSIRVYLPEPIPEAIMQDCLRLATLAPSSSNLQPWQFFWVRNQAKKQELVNYCLGQPAAATAPELIVAVSRPDFWKTNQQQMLALFNDGAKDKLSAGFDYYNRIVPLAYNQGFLGIKGLFKKIALFFIGLKKPTPRGPASQNDMRVWANKSTALACQNLMLALRAYNYDSCPMEGMDPVRIQKMLNLPSQAEICMVISAGKRNPSRGVYGKQIRFDSNLFIKIID